MELMGTSFRRCLGGLGLLAGVVMSSAALFLVVWLLWLSLLVLCYCPRQAHLLI